MGPTPAFRAPMFEDGTCVWLPLDELRAREEAEQRRTSYRRESGSARRARRAAASPAALDHVFTSTAGATFTLRQLFKALRKNGVRPHGLPAVEGLDTILLEGEQDEALAALIVAAGQTITSGATEDGVTPSFLLALDEAGFARVDPQNAGIQAPLIATMGTMFQVAAELARAGIGRIRRAGQGDIFWASLFPFPPADGRVPASGSYYQWGDVIPSPAEMLAAMRWQTGTDHGFARLGTATLMIITCLCYRQKLNLTPFNAGGGARQNLGAGNVAEAVRHETLVPITAELDAEDKWADVLAGMPPWQAGLLVESGLGWAAWYYDWGFGGGGVGPTASEQTYQKYALNVWPTEATIFVSPRTAYEQECARRKCLGVAAFSWAIGEWLAGIDAAFVALGLTGVTEVVDVIELCNEVDGFWQAPAEGQTTLTHDVSSGAREAGRFFALLAGPIWMQVPSMQFRLEVGTWAAMNPVLGPFYPTMDNFAEKLLWLSAALDLGMAEEAQRWGTLRRQRAAWGAGAPVSPELAAWFAAEVDGGFVWPPEAGALPHAANLLHFVGIHAFHDFDVDGGGNDYPCGYADAARLVSDIDAMRVMAAGLGTFPAYRLGLTVLASAFPAIDPGDNPDPSGSWGNRYDATSEVFQAAMHLRTTATLLAAGVAAVGIFDFSSPGLIDKNAWGSSTNDIQNWSAFASTGIHNDTLYGDSTSFLQGPDNWPRPALFTLRRLAWLLAQLGPTPQARMSILTNEQGLMVIELNFVAPIAVDPLGSALRQPYPRAYLVWIDQYADSADVHAPTQLRDQADLRFGTLPLPDAASSFELLSLVPEVTPPQAGDCTDSSGNPSICVNGNGYGVPSDVQWNWPGWDGALEGYTLVAHVDTATEDADPVHTDTGVEFPAIGTPGIVVIPPIREPREVATPALSGLGGAMDQLPTWDLVLRVVKANPQGGTALAPLCILTTLTYLGFT